MRTWLRALDHVHPALHSVRAGHHADVGGITPGSMPPTSRALVEEGAAIVSFKLVRGGAFQVHQGLGFRVCLCLVDAATAGIEHSPNKQQMQHSIYESRELPV